MVQPSLPSDLDWKWRKTDTRKTLAGVTIDQQPISILTLLANTYFKYLVVQRNEKKIYHFELKYRVYNSIHVLQLGP